jgi:hypothetical protein
MRQRWAATSASTIHFLPAREKVRHQIIRARAVSTSADSAVSVLIPSGFSAVIDRRHALIFPSRSLWISGNNPPPHLHAQYRGNVA